MIYDFVNTQFINSLQNLSHCLDKGVKYAETKKFEPEVLLQARLAPDQFPLMRQIQIVSDTAKFASARLCAKEAPAFADTEKTVAEAKERLQKTISFLKTLSANDYKGSEERRISNTRWEGKTMSGHDYLVQHAVPNFYFHLTTAYSILRHNGVEVGKGDFLGQLKMK